MARPRERTWLYGVVPWEETPHVCGWCGKIVKWPSEPQLEGHFSEEPEVIAKFDEYRGEHQDTLLPAPFREGGFYQPDMHASGGQHVGGSMCETCYDTGLRRKYGALLGQLRTAHPDLEQKLEASERGELTPEQKAARERGE